MNKTMLFTGVMVFAMAMAVMAGSGYSDVIFPPGSPNQAWYAITADENLNILTADATNSPAGHAATYLFVPVVSGGVATFPYDSNGDGVTKIQETFFKYFVDEALDNADFDQYLNDGSSYIGNVDPQASSPGHIIGTFDYEGVTVNADLVQNGLATLTVSGTLFGAYQFVNDKAYAAAGPYIFEIVPDWNTPGFTVNRAMYVASYLS